MAFPSLSWQPTVSESLKNGATKGITSAPGRREEAGSAVRVQNIALVAAAEADIGHDLALIVSESVCRRTVELLCETVRGRRVSMRSGAI
eukprot:COSAG06_NODE_24529_length_660_cov_0.645276_1_plen_90_part_00